MVVPSEGGRFPFQIAIRVSGRKPALTTRQKEARLAMGGRKAATIVERARSEIVPGRDIPIGDEIALGCRGRNDGAVVVGRDRPDIILESGLCGPRCRHDHRLVAEAVEAEKRRLVTFGAAILAAEHHDVAGGDGDKAVREQIAVLRPSLDAWPLASAAVLRLACAASLLPAFAVLPGAALLLYCIDPGVLRQRVTGVYAITASVAVMAIVGLPRLSARGRVALVVLSILALSAIGSELWN